MGLLDPKQFDPKELNPKQFEPKQFEPKQITVHVRWRLVIHRPGRRDAEELATALSCGTLRDAYLACPCLVERFIAYTDDDSGELLGEVVIGRQAFLPPSVAPV